MSVVLVGSGRTALLVVGYGERPDHSRPAGSRMVWLHPVGAGLDGPEQRVLPAEDYNRRVPMIGRITGERGERVRPARGHDDAADGRHGRPMTMVQADSRRHLHLLDVVVSPG